MPTTLLKNSTLIINLFASTASKKALNSLPQLLMNENTSIYKTYCKAFCKFKFGIPKDVTPSSF